MLILLINKMKDMIPIETDYNIFHLLSRVILYILSLTRLTSAVNAAATTLSRRKAGTLQWSREAGI